MHRFFARSAANAALTRRATKRWPRVLVQYTEIQGNVLILMF